MTKTKARELARRSLRSGYYDLGAGRVSADCCTCGKRVEAVIGYRDEPTAPRRNIHRRETPAQALTRALLDHYAWDGADGGCTGGQS